MFNNGKIKLCIHNPNSRESFLIKCLFQERALLLEIGLAKNPLKLHGLWDGAQKRSTNTASGTNPNIGKPATAHFNSTPCASVSFPSAPDIFVRVICIS